MEKKIEEIKALDDEGKESVQKMLKPIKREKEKKRKVIFHHNRNRNY